MSDYSHIEEMLTPAPVIGITVDKAAACAYLGISAACFDDWRRRGILPAPIAGTRRWSVKALKTAIDGDLDKAALDEAESALERWEHSQAS